MCVLYEFLNKKLSYEFNLKYTIITNIMNREEYYVDTYLILSHTYTYQMTRND